jgi:diketogulonate reductase-like aldo/keto reductase
LEQAAVTHGLRSRSPCAAGAYTKVQKSPIQIALAWGVNLDHPVIPKTTLEWRVKQNIEADFELEPADMEKIATMDINQGAVQRP